MTTPKHRKPGPVSPDLTPSGGRHKAEYTHDSLLAEMDAFRADATPQSVWHGDDCFYCRHAGILNGQHPRERTESRGVMR